MMTAPPPAEVATAAKATIGQARVAGTLAAATALATTELVSAPDTLGHSLIVSVGTEFISRFAGSLKDLAVAIFGTNDKPALIIGIVLVCLLFGAWLGRIALTRFSLSAAGIASLGAVGIWAGAVDPLASTARITAAAIAGVVVGIGTLAVLLRTARSMNVAAAQRDRGILNTDPTVKMANRRSFFTYSATAGTAAVGATVLARALHNATDVGVSRDEVVLPARPSTDTSLTEPTSFATGIEVAGISPYITPTDDFYRIDTALSIPRVDASKWRLKITGMVDNEVSFSLDDILAMDLVDEVVTIMCVSNEIGGDLIGTATWTGVPLPKLLDAAGIKPEATQLVGRSVDGWTGGFPTELASDGRVALLAVGMNGAPLREKHGFPARIILSGIYGYVSATKWISEIEATTWEAFDGFWVPRGWSKEGPVKMHSRIDVPRSKDNQPAGTVAIAGVAWSPNIGISAVEVRVGDADANMGTWIPATLGKVISNNTWVQWLAKVDLEPGTYVVEVRATDANGLVQTADRADVAPNGATGHHQRRIVVT
jgi:DMSO/TMAO reductase YedYZ molybdopterin-dependent catalytic subunit